MSYRFPLIPMDTVPACIISNHSISPTFIFRKQSQKSFSFYMPNLHIREIIKWYFFSIHHLSCVNQFKLFYIIRFFTFMDIRRSCNSMRS